MVFYCGKRIFSVYIFDKKTDDHNNQQHEQKSPVIMFIMAVLFFIFFFVFVMHGKHLVTSKIKIKHNFIVNAPACKAE